MLNIRRYKSIYKAGTSFNDRIRLKYELRRPIDLENRLTRRTLREEWLNSTKVGDHVTVDKKPDNGVRGMFSHTEPISFETYQNMSKHYYHPMENVLNAITDELVQKILIKLNVLKLKTGKDSMILINDMKLKKILNDLEISEDEIDINEDIEDFADSKIWYNYHQSGDYLNYINSETMRFVKGYKSRFTSVECLNDLEVGEFMGEIESYRPGVGDSKDNQKDNQKDIDKQTHDIDYMLKVIQMLVNLEKPPTLKLFKVLIDVLISRNLSSYVHTIIKHLIDNKYRLSLLADIQNDKLIVEYYKSFIQKEPEFLNTLINYHFERNEYQIVERLFSFLKFDEIVSLEKILHKSTFHELISMSRFTKNRSLTNLVPVDISTPLTIDSQTIYNIIDKCISMKKFEYIDLLVNKLLFHSVVNDESIKVFLSINQTINLDDVKFIIDTQSVESVILQVMNPQLILLLLKAINQSQDMGRLMWLIPNLDIYIMQNLEFKSLENHALPLELIFNIYSCLKRYGLDGKLVTYEKLFGIDSKMELPTGVELV